MPVVTERIIKAEAASENRFVPLPPEQQLKDPPTPEKVAEVRATLEVLKNTVPARGEIREIVVSRSNKVKSWRLVHDGEKVLAGPFESTGETGTRHTLFLGSTKEACEAEIARLKLIPIPLETRSQPKPNRLNL